MSSADVAVEPTTGQPVLRIQMNQDELARYGVPAKAVLDLVESLGSKPLGDPCRDAARLVGLNGRQL